MSALPTYFDDFMENIRLTQKLRTACEEAHQQFRRRLAADQSVREIIVAMFLQGSYRRYTGVRPTKEDDRADVDLVVVTSLSPGQYTPAAVVERFRPFLEREYPGQWTPSDRSIKIAPTGSLVTLDFVVTSALSEMQVETLKSLSEPWRFEARGDRRTTLLTEGYAKLQKSLEFARWQREPLLIPSRDLKLWVPTHPLAQIEWTETKNNRTAGHYVNVVKGIKWWWSLQSDAEYPKGYPLEHLVGQTCDDGIDSIAAGLVVTFEGLRDRYRTDVAAGGVPFLPDHGVPQNNVLKRITPAQFRTFWDKADAAARQARLALDSLTLQESATLWRRLFGNEFPSPPKTPAFVPPTEPARPTSGGRFG